MESVADLEVIEIKQNEFKYSLTWKKCFGTSVILKRLPLNLVIFFTQKDLPIPVGLFSISLLLLFFKLN